MGRNTVAESLEAGARDGNLDIEDVELALNVAKADGDLSFSERSDFESLVRQYADRLEPAAFEYLRDTLAGKAPAMPNRVLLAPHPPGTQRDLFYARNDVVALQESLTRLGFPTQIDGDYGPATVDSVKRFQASTDLEQTGNLDSHTLVKMGELLVARGDPPLDVTPRAHIRPDYVVALKNGRNTDDNKAIEEALGRLGRHFDIESLVIAADGRYDDATEEAVRVFQHLAYLPATGIVDRTTLLLLNEALETAGLPPADVKPIVWGAGFGGRVELHFYPGDHELKLYVIKDGRLLDSYGMVGGLAEGRPDATNPHVDYSPTPEGEYEVVAIDPHVSSAWACSYVPYGAHLREVGGEIQFRDSGGTWQWATGPESVFAGRNPPPLGRKAYLERDGQPMAIWTRNDFGHLRARLKSLSTGALQGHMIHSSPATELTQAYFSETGQLRDPAQALAVLRHSHGCEHIHPRDMDELIEKGYLTRGTRFVVHGYDETFPG